MSANSDKRDHAMMVLKDLIGSSDILEEDISPMEMRNKILEAYSKTTTIKFLDGTRLHELMRYLSHLISIT